MHDQLSIGLTHVAYRLPSRQFALAELERAGRLTSPAEFLRAVGFEHCRVQEGEAAFEDLLLECGQEVLSTGTVRPAEIGWLIRYSGLEPTHGLQPQPNGDALERFRYPLAHSQHRLDLAHAAGLALSQQGCSGLLSSLDLAARLLGSSEASAALCLASDALDDGSNREIL